MGNPCIKLYVQTTYYYQVIDKKIKEQVCLRLFVVDSCIIMYMMGLMLGQSSMVTGATVIVLHAKITPYCNVLHEAIN